MARTVVRGTPYTHIASPSANQGFRQAGSDGDSTVGQQYQGGGINTQQRTSGTPARYQHGNPDETCRVVSSDRYGMVESNAQGNANSPANNGNGVILDGMQADYASTIAAPALDSPVPSGAPTYLTSNTVRKNQMLLGEGASTAHAQDDILALNGVISRGMVQKSTPNGSETELTEDDTLPSVAPA